MAMLEGPDGRLRRHRHDVAGSRGRAVWESCVGEAVMDAHVGPTIGASRGSVDLMARGTAAASFSPNVPGTTAPAITLPRVVNTSVHA
jgi:hypothetical protein